jgi:hypothetical protein
MRTGFILAIFSAALGGCFILPDAQPPKSGAAVATGEPLAVVDDVKTWTTTSKEKVGESVVKDSSGNTVGTVDNYQTRTQVHSMKVWYPFQGQGQLSDEDFFRIANDQQAIDETAKLREHGQALNRDGKFAMLGGVVGLVAGLVIMGAEGSAPNAYLAGELVASAGSLVLCGGWYLAYHGASLMQPEVHAVDRSQAERDALQYNGAHSVGLGVSRNF